MLILYFIFEVKIEKMARRINDCKIVESTDIFNDNPSFVRSVDDKHFFTCGKWTTTFSSHATFLTQRSPINNATRGRVYRLPE